MHIYLYINNFIGTRLVEYEVFVRYYQLLLDISQRIYTYELYKCIHRHIMTNHRWIVQYYDHIQGMYLSDTDLLLAIIAMELHCGRTSSFYEMLKFMKNSKVNFQHLDAEIQYEVETFDPHKSFGMYINMRSYEFCSILETWCPLNVNHKHPNCKNRAAKY